jgi:hypothetical protein
MAIKPSRKPEHHPYLVSKRIRDQVPLIICHMRREFETCQELGACITEELDRIMGQYLVKESERGLWAQRDEGELTPSLWARFDDLIIWQTVSLGDLMEHSPVVQFRIQHWKIMSLGVERYRRYNWARYKNMRILHRLELPPIDPELKQFKKTTVRELQIVLQDLRGHFAKSRQRTSAADLIGRFRHIIAKNRCVNIQGNQASWEMFFEAKAQSIERLVTPDKRSRPAQLFDDWASWATTYKLESLRQKISLQKL